MLFFLLLFLLMHIPDRFLFLFCFYPFLYSVCCSVCHFAQYFFWNARFCFSHGHSVPVFRKTSDSAFSVPVLSAVICLRIFSGVSDSVYQILPVHAVCLLQSLHDQIIILRIPDWIRALCIAFSCGFFGT